MCVLTEWLDKYSEAITALATVAIAVFTIVLAKVSKKQFQITNAALDLARAEFISTHRPRIRIKHVWMVGIQSAGDRLVVRLLVVNTGDTTATIRTLRFGFHFSTADEEVLPDGILEAKDRRAVDDKVASGITLVYADLADGTVLTEQQVALMTASRGKLYCVGDVEYVDDLSAVRKTSFCRVWRNGKFRQFHHPDPDYEYHD